MSSVGRFVAAKRKGQTGKRSRTWTVSFTYVRRCPLRLGNIMRTSHTAVYVPYVLTYVRT